MADHANFITNERAAVVRLLEALDQLRSLKRQWDALGYADQVKGMSMAGSNADLTADDLTALVASAQDIDDYCTAKFHWTNLEKARP